MGAGADGRRSPADRSRPGRDLNRRCSRAAPFVLLGRISYPLYLWHFPLLVLARVQWGPSLSIPLTLRRGRRARARVAPTASSSCPSARSRAAVPGVPAAGRRPLAAVGACGSRRVPRRRACRTGCRSSCSAEHRGVRLKQAYRGEPLLPPALAGRARVSRRLRRRRARQAAAPLGRLARRPPLSRAPGGGTPAQFRIAQLTASACPPLLDYRSSERPKCHGINQAALVEARDAASGDRRPSAQWERYRSIDGLARTVAALRRARHRPDRGRRPVAKLAARAGPGALPRGEA